jgi:hypothetical protein
MRRRVEPGGKLVKKLPRKSGKPDRAPNTELQESDTSPGAREFQLGVLLVHGIGTPRAGDTLVHWGEVLLKTIAHATRLPEAEKQDRLTSSPSIPARSRGTAPEGVLVSVERADFGGSRENGRFEAVVRFGAGDHTERWLLREGLWAGAFPAPSYRELVSWSVRALPWSIVTHFGERYWQSIGRATKSWQALKLASNSLLKRPSDWARIVALATAIRHLIVALAPRVEAVFLVILSLALTPVLFTVLGLTLLIGLIPIPQIRMLVFAVQSTLTATVGDSFAFVESPIRAALIRECILDDLKRLKPLCVHTVVVAHSQGAAVVLDALGALEPSDEKRQANAVSPLVPDALITFGAGTNQLASQKVLADRIPTMKINPVLYAVLAILAVYGLSLWLYWSATTTAEILWGGALVLLFFIIQQLILLWRRVGSSPLQARWWKKEPGNTREDKADPWKDKYFIAFMAGLGILLNHFKNLPLTSIIWLLFALMLLAGSIRFILSSEGKKIVQAPVSRPLGLSRWIDLYASADPVPNGPTRTIEGEHDSKLIWNLGSLFADHTAYWNNRDGFVLRVARACAETAESPWTHKLPGESDFIDKRAAWRVGFLRVARWSNVLAWLVLGAWLWMRDQANVPLPVNLPSWVPAPLVQHALFVALIALAMWATSSALCWIWSWWVRAEQEVVLDHEQPGRKSDESIVGNVVIASMAMVVSLLIATVVYVLMYIRSWEDLGILTNRDEFITLMIGPFIFALLCLFLPYVLKCRPPDASKGIGTPLKT